MNKLLVVNQEYEYFFIKESGSYLLDYNHYKNIHLTIDVAPYIDVKITMIHIADELVSDIHYRIMERSHVEIFKFYHVFHVKEKVSFDLNGIDASVSSYFRSLTCDKEEYHIEMNHNEKQTKSLVNNKAISCRKGNLSFILDSNLGKDKTGCVLEQDSVLLTLDEGKATICPNMFISNDDVMARHGAVVGTFQQDDLFYLMSRGLSFLEAQKLLVKGLLLSNLDIEEDQKEQLNEIINQYWR